MKFCKFQKSLRFRVVLKDWCFSLVFVVFPAFGLAFSVRFVIIMVIGCILLILAMIFGL